MSTYPKIGAIEPLTGKRLRVFFKDGAIRVYDCKPLLEDSAFRLLSDEAFFRNVKADAQGFGISWNDEVDLAESELWLNGRPEPEVVREHS